MERRMNGLCLELISHPGETIAEYLEERCMSQEELAVRTGFSKKHISEVVNGKKGISAEFAKALEYALGVPMHFWVNLQANYDKDMLIYHEQNNISKEELGIVKKLKDVIKMGEKYGVLLNENKAEARLFELRNLCQVINLCVIPEVLATKGRAYRKAKNMKIDQTILYVWLVVSEKHAENTGSQNTYDEAKLRKRLPEIKKCMFLEQQSAIIKLQTIFEECGITFHVMQYVKGAPVQGYIKKQGDRILLTMTTRRKFADEFWFTLFHEIGHILEGDFQKDYHIDFEEDMENNVDSFAANYLINPDAYKTFLSQKDFSEASIIRFAKKQKVMPFIVAGRLQREFGNYQLWSKLKVRYEWE